MVYNYRFGSKQIQKVTEWRVHPPVMDPPLKTCAKDPNLGEAAHNLRFKVWSAVCGVWGQGCGVGNREWGLGRESVGCGV